MADYQTRRLGSLLEESVYNSQVPAEELVETINRKLALSYMSNHTAKITIIQEGEKEPGITTSREGIITVYEALGTDRDITATTLEAAFKWAGDSLATAVIPKYRCSGCMRDEKEVEDNPIVYTPIDVMSFFGLAMKTLMAD